MMSAFMFPIYFATEGTTEDREVWYQERPMLGPDRPERGKANSQ